MMSAPTLHDLQFFRDAFVEIQLSDCWAISTSKSDDVIWNVVLSYLNSFPVSNEDDELTACVQCLNGHQEVNTDIKHSIQTCNPFLYRDACFNDKNISNLVAKFKERVEDYINNCERLFPIPAKNCGYLEASSILLFCNIVLISIEDKIATVFPAETPSNPRTIFPKCISIIDKSNSTKNDENIQDQFSFCIPKQVGIEKKKLALIEILKRARNIDNEKNIQKVIHSPDITENFLVSLLKNNYGDIIPSIYASASVLSKLAEAGFETDPRSKDSSGKSAFFYALKTNASNIVSLLYNHAANTCLQTYASVRSPDAVIVDNLLCLKEYLKLLGKDLESEEISEKSRCLYRDLYRFNEFQIEICRSISNIKAKYYGQTNTENEASQRKEIILTVLKTYETHFNYINGESEPSVDESIRFQEFLEHKYYIDNLDLSSALMFFDNLFLLKERLKLPKNPYLGVESNFFLYVFFSKYLEQYKTQETFFISQLMTFQNRLSLQTQLCSFRGIIEATELSLSENIVHKIPKKAILTLTNLPLIYGQYLISRLKHYLKAATELTFKGIKSILVIERCLQVIGECCEEKEFKSVQSIIILALSKDFSKRLNGIRHRLSHIKSNEIFYRKKLEHDVELFIEIKKELIKLSELLRPIYSIHENELDQFLLSYPTELIKKGQGISILEEYVNQQKTILPSTEMEESQLLETPLESKLQKMLSSLELERDNLNFNRKFLQKNNVSRYRRIIQNMISSTEEVLKNVEFAAPDKVVELDSHFWCLEKILTYMTTDRKQAKYQEINKPTEYADIKQAEYRSMLEKVSKDRNSLFGKLMEKASKLQEINKTTNSVTVGHSVSDPKKITQNEENDSSFAEASTYRDVRLPDNVNQDCPVKGEAEGLAETKGAKRKSFKEYVTIFLDDYRKIARIIFQEYPEDSNEIFHFQNIENYFLKLERKKILTENEKKFVLNSVPKKFRNVPELKKEIKALLKEKVEFTEELNYKLSTLKLKNKDIKEIKREIERGCIDDTVHYVNSARDYFLCLTKVMNSEVLYKKNYEDLCEKLELSKAAKKVLFQLVPLKKGGPEQKLEFLRNRIKMLKNILIDEHYAIHQLSEKETTSNRIMIVKEKIVQLYLKNFEIQASVQTILFHCMIISKNKKLKQLWKKATNLFSGINLRNVLAHGHPLMESLGTLLDPYDLPSELVGKMLQLISDEYVIDCMQQIVEKSGTYRIGFRTIMDDKNNEQFMDLRKQILECDRWESYALLIPKKKDPKKKNSKKKDSKKKDPKKKRDMMEYLPLPDNFYME